MNLRKANFDLHYDLELARSKGKLSDEDIDKHVKKLLDDKDMPGEYKDFLLCALMNEGRLLSLKGKGENNYNDKHSTFRKNLLSILKKPYDEEEYKRLRLDIEVHRAHHLDPHVVKLDKSYLDHYPDLKEKLLRFQDDEPKCLNLLRGFFFWLQYLPMEGSFEPWKDPLSLMVKQERRPS
ncbi:unnamed protein product [Fraxinus pennsylvanica]|uniref:Uncharacterized protein n=1 Tax=Fraxinus pennsylvanica TaxID=56036 RepID=A0AAD1Z6D4_9LAMI|nr:unnamed protein product [Fraxinus pennsylvanica]